MADDSGRQLAVQITGIENSATVYPADQAVIMARRRIELLSARLAGHHNPKSTAKWQEIGMLKGLINGTKILRDMDIEVMIFPSELEGDKGKPVVQIDSLELSGPLRINLNDGAIWDADPEEEGPPAENQSHAFRLNRANNIASNPLEDGTGL